MMKSGKINYMIEEDSSIPIKPQRVMHALRQVAHDDAILSVDVGNVTVWI